MDQGTMLTKEKMKAFAQQFDFWLVHSSPYYAQANRQAEATNNVMIDMIKKTMQDKPRIWHEVLSEIQWTYKNSTGKFSSYVPGVRISR